MTALLLMADGFEEIEAVTIADVLRRGGVSVTIAGTQGKTRIEGAHGMPLEADCILDTECMEKPFALVACPGGLGCMRALSSHSGVLAYLAECAGHGAFVSAICASPVVLYKAGLLKDRRFCCYPGMQSHISGGTYVPDALTVQDGKILTGTGPATALPFALLLLEVLAGKDVRDSVAAGMLASC